MKNKKIVKTALLKINWVEGAIVPILEAPYRYRIVVHCSESGRRKAVFANGEHSYFCYIETVFDDGRWTEKSGGMVPVLPDGRLIMVVEQRPAQGRYMNRPMIAVIGGGQVDLRTFGTDSSLEFPGGAVEPGEGLKAGFLRELVEETGVEEQTALYYGRLRPLHPFGSDLALQSFLGVVYLSGLSYEEQVKTDGGLHVLAITREEVQQNIWNGVINSGQAALLQWGFYQEVEDLRNNPLLEKELVRSGYMSIEHINIAHSR